MFAFNIKIVGSAFSQCVENVFVFNEKFYLVFEQKSLKIGRNEAQNLIKRELKQKGLKLEMNKGFNIYFNYWI